MGLVGNMIPLMVSGSTYFVRTGPSFATAVDEGSWNLASRKPPHPWMRSFEFLGQQVQFHERYFFENPLSMIHQMISNEYSAMNMFSWQHSRLF